MSVYSARIMNDITTSLMAIAGLTFANTQLVLTANEFISAYISPDHVPKLKEMEQLVGFVGSTSMYTNGQTSTGVGLRLYFNFKAHPPVILPRYTSSGMQPNCPEDVRSKIIEWVDERYRLGCIFGDALDALEHLNRTCGDDRAMKLMLPALVTIMAKNSKFEEDRMVKRAKKLSDRSGFGSLPRMTPANRERLKEISAVINMMAMLPDNQDYKLNRGDALVCRSSTNNIGDVRPNIFSNPSEVMRTATFV
jgi:hypothetical protein